MRKFSLLSVPVLLFSTCAMAQDSTKVTTLREVVVSATRTEQPVIEIPRSVTVIHEDVIQTSIYQSLGDLLNAQSGLYVVGANQTPGMNQNVFMRGSNSNQVAVLIDGVRITDPSSPNAAVDLSEISLANVERVEIIRGSHSTMFGGAAVGGVINLITKKDGSPGFHGVAGWQGGTFGKETGLSSGNINLQYGDHSGLYFDGSVFREDVRGLDASDKTVSTSFTADRDNFEKTDASLKAGFRNESWYANVSFKNVHQYTEIDNGAFSDDDNYYLTFDRKLMQYYAGYNLNPFLRFSVLGSFSNSQRFYKNDSSKVSATAYDKAYVTGTNHGKLQTHEVALNFKKEKVEGVFGGGLYSEKMFFDNYFFYNDPLFPFESVINYDTLDTHTTTRYVFAQAGYSPGNFNLSAGTRLSSHTTAGNFMTFEINPSFTFNDLLIFGSLSTGFNAPSLYQLYDPSKSYTAYTTRGNSNLNPEKSLSLEAGIKRQFSSGSYLTFSGYQTRIINAIEYVYLWNGSTPVEELDYTDDRGDTYINAGEQLVKGLELESHVAITDQLSIQVNGSVMRGRIKMKPENIDLVKTGGHHVQLYNQGIFINRDIEQEHLVRRPDFTIFARIDYKLVSDLTLSATYRHTGRRFDSGYDPSLGPYGGLARINVHAYRLVDAGINWQATKIFGVAFKVENLFNESYRELAGFQTRGRSAYVKFTARW